MKPKVGVLLLLALGVCVVLLYWRFAGSRQVTVPRIEPVPRETAAPIPTPPVQPDPVDRELLSRVDAAIKDQVAPDPDGLMEFDDVVEGWDNREERYIEYLKKESLEDGLFRLHNGSERMIIASGSPTMCAPDDRFPSFVKTALRTRRFSKLVFAAVEAVEEGTEARLVGVIDATVDRLLEERNEVIKKARAYFQERPGLLDKDGPYSDAERAVYMRLYRGGASVDCTEEHPPGLEGIRVAISLNAYLLGLLGHPAGVAPLLKAYAKTEYCGVIADVDALDRIFVSCARRTDIPPAARHVVDEYLAWCAERRLPARKTAEVYPFDAARTPYTLAGKVTGAVPRCETKTLELPFVPASSKTDIDFFSRLTMMDDQGDEKRGKSAAQSDSAEVRPGEDPNVGLTRADVELIHEYGERFQNAYSAR